MEIEKEYQLIKKRFASRKARNKRNFNKQHKIIIKEFYQAIEKLLKEKNR